MERKKLLPEEILRNLAEMDDWRAESDVLHKKFKFRELRRGARFR
jgi:pterin-4a-carbinolamine dehydratase